MVRELQTLDHTAVLLDSALVVIQLKNVALKSAERTQAALDSAYTAKDNEAQACRSLVGVNDQIHKEQLKTARKKGFKWGAIITGTGFTILDILLILALL